MTFDTHLLYCAFYVHTRVTRNTELSKIVAIVTFPVSDFYLIFFLLYQLAEIYELIIITFQSCAMPNFGGGFGIKKNQNYDASFLSINKKWLPFTELNNYLNNYFFAGLPEK